MSQRESRQAQRSQTDVVAMHAVGTAGGRSVVREVEGSSSGQSVFSLVERIILATVSLATATEMDTAYSISLQHVIGMLFLVTVATVKMRANRTVHKVTW